MPHVSPDGTPVFKCKVILIGNSTCGKTSILNRFAHGVFTGTTTSTTGQSFEIKHLQVESKLLKLTLWDTAGQERFQSLNTIYYRDIVAAVMVFDLCDRDSFVKLSHHMEELKRNAPEDFVAILVGNKLDLLRKGKQERQVSNAEALQFVVANGPHIVGYVEASAKSGEGIETAFTQLGQRAIEVMQRRRQEKEENGERGTSAADKVIVNSYKKKADHPSCTGFCFS